MLNQLLDGHSVKHYDGFMDLPVNARGAIVVFHGQHSNHPGITEKFNRATNNLDWVLYVSIGDEGGTWPYHLLEHKNKKVWIQTPKPGLNKADRYLIEGYPPDCQDLLSSIGDIHRTYDWYFAGQVNHERRTECAKALSTMFHGKFCPTSGFWQGLGRDEYYTNMRMAKVIPCPSGPLTPDSFRFAEAMEAGCIPILDAYALDHVRGYWTVVFGTHPFRVIENWSYLPEMVQAVIDNFDEEQKKTQLWWKQYKQAMQTVWLSQDLISLRAM